jgi:hypothetical protein
MGSCHHSRPKEGEEADVRPQEKVIDHFEKEMHLLPNPGFTKMGSWE